VELPQAGLLVSAAEDGSVRVWDSRECTFVREWQAANSGAAVRALVSGIDDGDELLWIGDSEGSLRLCTIKERQFIHVQTQAVTGSSSSESFSALRRHPDGSIVFAADTMLAKLSPRTLQELHKQPRAHRSHISSLVCCPVDGTIVTSSFDNAIGVWSYKLDPIIKLQYHDAKLQAVDLLGDSLLVSGGFDLRLCLFDMREAINMAEQGKAAATAAGATSTPSTSASSSSPSTSPATSATNLSSSPSPHSNTTPPINTQQQAAALSSSIGSVLGALSAIPAAVPCKAHYVLEKAHNEAIVALCVVGWQLWSSSVDGELKVWAALRDK